MSENKELTDSKLQIEKLWLETEKKIATNFNPEDLRTSGLLSVKKNNWKAAFNRLSEAAFWGLRDFQLLDALGEAAHRVKSPQTLLEFESYYTQSEVAVHMARAHLMMGQIEECQFFLNLAEPTLLVEAIRRMATKGKNIEKAIEVITTPFKNEVENLNFSEYWQLAAAVADVAKDSNLVAQSERKLKSVAYDRPVIHFNQALRLLTEGEISAGFKLYEWRLAPNSPCAQPTHLSDIAMWEGEVLNNKSLLVVLENGFGDQIFSMRYIKLLQQQNIKIEIAVAEDLIDLAQNSFNECKVHDLKNIRNSDYWSHKLKPDFWVYSFSIPTRVSNYTAVFADVYLSAENKKVNEIKEKIALINKEHLKIKSLVWHGDTRTPAMRTRAYTLEEFLDITQVLKEPCVVVNLQKNTKRRLYFVRSFRGAL